jgi:nanoRNase/pAp phosphatase (c-di-AMP/oligoRNAs hydrolase)
VFISTAGEQEVIIRIETNPPDHSISQLLETLASVDEALIVPHNDPDPDAIACAVALQYILQQKANLTSQIAYLGIIGRAENRALVRYLGHPLIALGDRLPTDLPVILVDTQPGTGNNPWRPGFHLAGVIDHHPFKEQSNKAAFVDVRPEYGAASTIFTRYCVALNLDIPVTLATALFYGIKTDTRGLSRAVNNADAAAYFNLQPRIDTDALAEIERAEVPVSYFRVFVEALEKAELYGAIAISFVGTIDYPDMAAEMADLLLRLENVEWVICTGLYQDRLMLAVRAPNGKGDAGRLVRDIVRGEGTAGGHDTMAGGQIRLNDDQAARMVAKISRRVRRVFGIDPAAKAQPFF